MIGIWLPLIMYRNSYEDYRMVISDLTYGDLARSDQGHMTFHRLSQKRGMIGIWLPLVMYTNSYEDYRMVISYLTYGDLARSDQGHMTFHILYLRMGHDRHMVTIDHV